MSRTPGQFPLLTLALCVSILPSIVTVSANASYWEACTLLSIGLLLESALAEQLIREPGKGVHLGQRDANIQWEVVPGYLSNSTGSMRSIA